MLLASSGSSSWYSEPRNFGALFKLVAYPVAFLVAGIVGWWHKHKQKVALNWPSIEGRVQFASVAPVQDSSGSYIATLEYSYFVGEYRSGEYTEIFDSENGANKFVEMMKDQKVPVRYNPSNPDDSLIEEADVEQFAALPSPVRLKPLK